MKSSNGRYEFVITLLMYSKCLKSGLVRIFQTGQASGFQIIQIQDIFSQPRLFNINGIGYFLSEILMAICPNLGQIQFLNIWISDLTVTQNGLYTVNVQKPNVRISDAAESRTIDRSNQSVRISVHSVHFVFGFWLLQYRMPKSECLNDHVWLLDTNSCLKSKQIVWILDVFVVRTRIHTKRWGPVQNPNEFGFWTLTVNNIVSV